MAASRAAGLSEVTGSTATRPLRWGFLGTGSIAGIVARDLALVDGATRYAVASRNGERAAAFGAAEGFARSYSGYEELLADPDVDVVYVATPHAQHHMVTSAVLAAGKPALVEKAFTCTAPAAHDLVRRAGEAGLFMMEAMWTRFVPTTVQAREWIADGAVGRVRQVHADLGFIAPYDPAHRLFDPAQGGGALLDLGVYPVSFAQMVLGAPSSVQALGVLADNGVDVEDGLVLGHPDGAQAVLSVSLTSDSPGRAVVVGTEGRITVEPRFHHSSRVVLERPGHDPVVAEPPLSGRGYTHQMVHVADCLGQGLGESPVMPLADTLAVMETLHRALDLVGSPHVDEGFPV